MSAIDQSNAVQAPSRLRAYLELLRIPNVFTALADVMMGFLVTHASAAPFARLASLLAASACLYLAGMVLNDFFDRRVDADQRPARPLPSGRIRPAAAATLGAGLLVVGVALGWMSDFATGVSGGVPLGGLTASALAATVLAYDAGLKRTPLGPLAMGGCRSLNVLLGMSAAAAPWEAMHGAAAGGLGLYIVGVTWFARTEAVASRRAVLAAAAGVMMLGIGLAASAPWWADADTAEVSRPIWAWASPERWVVFWLLLAGVIGWRAMAAVFDPRPARVQRAVKLCIFSVIVLDAAICFAVRGPFWAVLILLLLAPTAFLGRWIYST